jgi:hypothetical protein
LTYFNQLAVLRVEQFIMLQNRQTNIRDNNIFFNSQ